MKTIERALNQPPQGLVEIKIDYTTLRKELERTGIKQPEDALKQARRRSIELKRWLDGGPQPGQGQTEHLSKSLTRTAVGDKWTDFEPPTTPEEVAALEPARPPMTRQRLTQQAEPEVSGDTRDDMADLLDMGAEELDDILMLSQSVNVLTSFVKGLVYKVFKDFPVETQQFDEELGRLIEEVLNNPGNPPAKIQNGRGASGSSMVYRVG